MGPSAIYGGLIAFTKRELEERARGYAVIIDGRIVQVICKTCRKRLWGGCNEYGCFEGYRGMW